MSFVVVIPARYQSTRLPGKPLLEVAGKPILQHVVEKARQSGADEVIVATDDQRIKQYCDLMGIPVCMTAADHQSGTDRIEEVCRLKAYAADRVIVNVQGDEPMIPPAVIDQVADNLDSRPDYGICTLYEPMEFMPHVLDPNAVKVVTSESGRALYFSRAPIPWPRDAVIQAGNIKAVDAGNFKRHVGIYAYRASVLQQFVGWAPSPLEEQEKLEQLRALENGVLIHAEQACHSIPPGVDTRQDLDNLRVLLA